MVDTDGGWLPPVGTEGVVTDEQQAGATRLHQIDFGDKHGGVLLALPSRHLHLSAPSRGWSRPDG